MGIGSFGAAGRVDGSADAAPGPFCLLRLSWFIWEAVCAAPSTSIGSGDDDRAGGKGCPAGPGCAAPVTDTTSTLM